MKPLRYVTGMLLFYRTWRASGGGWKRAHGAIVIVYSAPLEIETTVKTWS